MVHSESKPHFQSTQLITAAMREQAGGWLAAALSFRAQDEKLSPLLRRSIWESGFDYYMLDHRPGTNHMNTNSMHKLTP